MWKGKLFDSCLSTGQQGYVDAEKVLYPDGVEVIDCALGTNPLGMPPSLREVLRNAGEVSLCEYPDPLADRLRESIASHYPSWNVRSEHLIAGSGSMGILVNLFRLLIGPGTAFAGFSPQFTDGVLQGLYTGAAYHPVRLSSPAYTLSPAGLESALEEGVSLLYIDRPHNPTGQVLPLEEMGRLARLALGKGCWVLSDEAYGDFMDDGESAALLDLPNIVTCRSFSKGRGAAGIRVGYAVTRNAELASALLTLQPPFASGTLDTILAEAALRDASYHEESRRYVLTAKEKILQAVEKKIDVTAADTDLRVPILLLSQERGDLVRRLADQGISCEPGKGFFDLDNRSVRLRVPSPPQLEEFLQRITRM